MICGTDPDWFSIDADAGDTLQVDLNHNTASGDLDLYLYEDGDDFRASHVSTRARSDGRLASKWCYWAVIEGDRLRSSSVSIGPGRPDPANH